MIPDDLARSARRSGANRWIEIQMFEMLGSWVQSTPEPEVKLLLDRHSFHHAWRAQQWWDRLPVVAGTDRESLVAPGSEAGRLAVGAVAALEGTIARLAGAYRVLIPRLAAAYARQSSCANPVADSSTIRTLAIVSADLSSDWAEGEFRLHALLTSPEAAGIAAGAVAGLEATLSAEDPIWLGTAAGGR